MSGLPSLELSLSIGGLVPLPGPAHLTRALRGVEITQRDSAPSGFQLTFLAELDGGAFNIASDVLLTPMNRVIVQAIVDGLPTVLMDGIITHQQYVPSNGPQDSVLVVTGEDVSVLLDRIEVPMEYPAMADVEIVAAVLEPFAAFGLEPLIIPPLMSMVPLDYVPQQVSTPRAFLQQLAARNGNVFFVKPLVELVNVAYWGPPVRIGLPSAVIDVAVGAASTADAFTATFDALSPEIYTGFAMEETMEPFLPLPVATLMSTRLPPLATRPALPMYGRIKLWNDDSQLEPAQALAKAQALTDQSTDNVVTVECTVQPARLGRVVTAPGLVGVRGTGEAYDGLYYLKAATHQIQLTAGEGWDYSQQLTLTREGIGTTTPVLPTL